MRRILIANRGEIADRILNSIHALGKEALVLYHHADADMAYVQRADVSAKLSGEELSETYLNIEQILTLAKANGADAVHPGYGFLSENADFAQAVMDLGMVWIGPSPKAMTLMGEKVSAREVARRAGVPLAPSTDDLASGSAAQKEAKEIGYPVLLKARYGGGGKGMRLVQSELDILDAFERAQSESQKAFGKPNLYMEKYLQNARHVEVQILGDSKGNLVTLLDRDCSIQRRHQKIIEEAPAPGLSEKTRKKMAEASLSLCKEVGYQSAGTIEYMVDADENFFFLEMNTRLQVEHPVTEWVTGIDLVAAQIHVAEGKDIPKAWSKLSPQGHAIECRIYAERPYDGYLPDAGLIEAWQTPDFPFARVDSAIEAGSKITTRFDPMIAKVSVQGNTREDAIERMLMFLEQTVVSGLSTNRDHLHQILSDEAFVNVELDTEFLNSRNYSRRTATSDLLKDVLDQASKAFGGHRIAINLDPRTAWQNGLGGPK